MIDRRKEEGKAYSSEEHIQNILKEDFEKNSNNKIYRR
jgi:hypothetical protein